MTAHVEANEVHHFATGGRLAQETKLDHGAGAGKKEEQTRSWSNDSCHAEDGAEYHGSVLQVVLGSTLSLYLPIICCIV